MSNGRLLIFDMDGVLVDVTDSYRSAIIASVKDICGAEITQADIQRYKNRGNSNNDWDLTLEIAREHGSQMTRDEVIAIFQRIYLGENCTGMISRERWLPKPGLLDRLAARFRFALFTGRESWEAKFTLKKFVPQMIFDPVIGMHEVSREKPDPEGMLKIIGTVQPAEVFYVGDVMDDFRAAQAAGVPFIGVVKSGNGLRDELGDWFREQGARAVISDVNELESVLP
jgi:HAD superfamily phosphatase